MPRARFFQYLVKPNRRRLARVVREHYQEVWRLALKLTGNEDDAADVTQEVFLALLLSPPKLAEVSSPRGYLAWRVVARVSRLRRTLKRRRQREEEHAQRLAREVTEAQRTEVVRETLAQLPEDDRTALELRYLAGLSSAEVAHIFGVGERAARLRIEKARERLRRQIGPLLAGTGALGLGTAADAAAPPVTLLPQLLRVAEAGGALGPAFSGSNWISTTTRTGGLIVRTKNTLSAAVVALIAVGLGTFAVIQWSARKDQLGEPGPADSTHRVAKKRVRHEPPPAPRKTPTPVRRLVEERHSVAESRSQLSSLHGAIVDETAAPVAGLTLTLTTSVTADDEHRFAELGLSERVEQMGLAYVAGGTIRIEATTGDDGGFDIGDLLPLKYLIVVETDGLLLRHPFRQPFEVPLEPGERKAFRIELSHGYSLYGTVLDEAGVPIDGAEVLIDGNLGRHLDSCTGGGGWGSTCTIPVHPNGEYDSGAVLIVGFNIDAALSPKARAPGYVTQSARVARAEEFVNRRARRDFVLQRSSPLASLRLRVLDSHGGAIANANVRANARIFSDRWSSTTNAEGELSAGQLERRSYTFTVTKEGYHPQSTQVDLKEDTTREIRMRSIELVLKGRVRFDEIPGSFYGRGELALFALNKNGEFRPTDLEAAEFSKEREFVFYPREPGDYRVSYSLNFRWAAGLEAPREYRSPRVKVIAGMVGHADVIVHPEPPYISGKVVDPSGAPKTNVPVLATIDVAGETSLTRYTDTWMIDDFGLPMLIHTAESRAVPNNPTVATSSEGRFLFLLPRTARDVPGNARRLVLHAGSKRDGGYSPLVSFDYKNDSEIEDIVLEILAPGSIEGSVVDADGAPHSSELLVAFDGLGTYAWTLSDQKGRYRLEALRPGHYLVLALGPSNLPSLGGTVGYGERAWRLPPPYEFFEFPVKVQSGDATTRNLRVDLERLGAIDGEISGAFSEEYYVRCGALFDGELHQAAPFGKFAGVDHRTFRLERLFPGRYRVWLTRGGGERLAAQEVQVELGRRSTVLLTP